MPRTEKPLVRCAWPGDDPLMIAYHDEEWGAPLRDDRKLFEFVVLDAVQAGLSWRTVLHRREAYRRALHGFDPERIARYDDRDMARLLADAGLVRNRAKMAAIVRDARCFLEIQREHGSFADFVWGFVGGAPIVHRFRALAELPATSPESEAMSKALKARGFQFVGPTICYAFMQAAGLVNDHVISCFRHRQLAAERKFSPGSSGRRPRIGP
jgi:DNA-3-methyladenine glycosylase I